ncbi:MAG: carotenoid 1,2-hydratase, partial [Chloroflexota bacterium]
MKRTIIFIAIIGVCVAGYFYWQNVSASAIPAASVSEFLAGDVSDDFARVTEERTLEFPQALGAHPEYQTEWWYYTGNVETDDGRQFGYQFTIFRRAITPPPDEDQNSESNWRTEQIYFAHAAIADIDNNSFLFGDHFSRGAAGLAGAESSPYYVWIEDWEVREIEPGKHEMYAQKEGVGFRFTLTETQTPVLHG